MPKYKVVFKGVVGNAPEAMPAFVDKFRQAYNLSLEQAEDRLKASGGVLYTFDDPEKADKAKRFMEGLGATVDVRMEEEMPVPELSPAGHGAVPPPLPPQGSMGAGPAYVPARVVHGPPPQPSGMPVIGIIAIIGVVFFFIAIIGILAAIAIPNFLKFQSKAKQSEAKSNLSAIFVCEIAYFGENECYGRTFEGIGWHPEGTYRYAYFLGDDVVQPFAGPSYQLPEGIDAYVDENGFKAIAVGNIDADPDLDVWVIDQDKNLTNVINDLF